MWPPSQSLPETQNWLPRIVKHQFAVDETGNIYKNATKKDAKWVDNKINRASGNPHHFSVYDISFAARVVVEVTYIHGGYC